MTLTYAKTTTVPVEKTRAEIEATLKRWGADAFMYAEEKGQVMVAFKFNGLTARFPVPLPDRQDRQFTKVKISKYSEGDRPVTQQDKLYNQAVLTRWRNLLLLIKAKLAAIEIGVATFEQEFLPYLVLPDGRTVTDELMPQIYQSLEQGHDFPMLPAGS